MSIAIIFLKTCLDSELNLSPGYSSEILGLQLTARRLENGSTIHMRSNTTYDSASAP